MPKKDAEIYHRRVPGAVKNGDGTWSFPCQNIQLLEPLILHTQNGPLVLPPEALFLTPMYPTSRMCLSGVSGQKVQSWVLGDVFLKHFYTVNNHTAFIIITNPDLTRYLTSVVVRLDLPWPDKMCP